MKSEKNQVRVLPPPEPWWTSREGLGRRTLLVIVVALSVRLFHLLELHSLPWFQVLQMDALYHSNLANRLALQGWTDSEPYFRAPFYPYFLAIIRSVTGELLWSARCLQILLGVATVALVHRLAERLLSIGWGLACGIVTALLWSPVHHETELLLEPVLTFQITLLLYLLVVQPGPRVGALRRFILGLLAGLATVTRPNFAVFLPVVIFYVAASTGESDRGAGARVSAGAGAGAGAGGGAGASAGASRKMRRSRARIRRLYPLLPLLLGIVLPVLPVWIHNARHGDPGTLVAWQGGINLYIGNNPESNGWAAIAPGMRTDWRGGYQDALRLAREGSHSNRDLRPSEVSAYWTGQAVRFWRENFIQGLRLTALKVALFWGQTEIKNNEDPGYFRHTMASLRWLPFSFGLLAPPALLGMILAWRKGRGFRLLVTFVALWMASIVPFFVCARYRLPVAILLPIFSVYFVRVCRDWVRDRRWRRLFPTLVICAALFVALSADPAGANRGGYFQSYCNLGDVLSEQGRWSEAVAAYTKAIEMNPKYLNSYNNLGTALEKLGKKAEAEEAYRRAVECQPKHPQARRNLALVLEARGKLPEAEQVLSGLVGEYPEGWDLWFFLGRVRETAGATGPAIEAYRKGLTLMPSASIPRSHLIRLLAASGDSAEAVSALREGLSLQPQNEELLRLQDLIKARAGFRN